MNIPFLESSGTGSIINPQPEESEFFPMSDTSSHGDVRTLKFICIMYVFIFAIKLATYFVSGVMALLAEALHTLSDLFISGFLLIAVIWSQKNPDEAHMFGHGRAQNVAALVASTLFISFTSFKLYEEGIPRLFSHEAAEYKFLWLAFWVIVVSIVIAATPLIKMLGQKEKGAAAKAQFLELINDELGLLAALAGIVGIMCGYPLADPLASVAVATIIAFNAVGLFRENLAFLLGKAPDNSVKEAAVERANAVKGVLNAHGMRAEYVSPSEIHMDLHIVVERGLPVEDADRISREVRESLQQIPGVAYCMIHVNAAKEGISAS